MRLFKFFFIIINKMLCGIFAIGAAAFGYRRNTGAAAAAYRFPSPSIDERDYL